MDLLPFVDILKVFNNPINEEQAWAVCYQSACFLSLNQQQQEIYQFVVDLGIHSIWLSRQGDVLIKKRPPDHVGLGKGPPHYHTNSDRSPTSIISSSRKHVHATETDAVQALGTAIFEALDYGIEATEERQLSQGLESLIVTMTNADTSLESDQDALNADDEGIEKDADIEHRCTVKDVLKICSQHLSSKQDVQHHYKAVCRALATEAGELFTFLEKITNCKERLSETQDEDSKRLEDLQRADWACLWVHVMRSLRQGVGLKKVAHVHLPPVEYELTPFEILLEDIRSRRYTLHKIMVNGDIPHKVKDDAQAVILDFIRSRPPLKKVHERKLKPKPPPAPDPHELLLKEIRSKPTLKPVRNCKLVVGTSGSSIHSDDDIDAQHPVKKVIKPDLNLLLNSSFEESSEDEDHLADTSLSSSPSSPSNNKSSMSSWQRSGDGSSHRPTRLQRRHTIMVCESSLDRQVSAQELPPLEEEEEPSPVRESHHFSNNLMPKQCQSGKVLSRTSFSDNDICNQVTLRHSQSHQKKLSLEHRRSLTSLSSDLCAIPEMEDSPGGTDPSTRSQGTMLRSWSHEQAPPPNPSPPCKGRARTAMGMNIKSSVGTHHPSQHRLHAPLTSQFTPNMTTNQTIIPEKPVDSVQTTFSALSYQRSFPSSLKQSLTTPLPSQPPDHNGNLDPTVSSQSPSYSRKLLTTQQQNQTLQNGKPTVEQPELSAQRWRHPNASYERLNRNRNITNDVSDISTQLENQHLSLSNKDLHRRLSLDSRMNIYRDDSNTSSETAAENKRPSRRLSFGVHKRGRGGRGGVGHSCVKSPEEEERLQRWRVLQNEELASRKVGRDINLQSDSDSTRKQPDLVSVQPIQSSQQVLSSPKLDVFQQVMADEEARFARWRRLEETGIAGSHEELSQRSATDKDYVSDALSSRLKPVAATNPLAAASNHPSTHHIPKRWQNPVECLSLTLEEVTHIRTVLTKAEVESLISHPDLYQQVSKSKICFTCKTSKFALFGEWGTKCRFCKRTICSKCLRKMNIPADDFKHIPVYTLCPSPLTQEMQDSIQNFIKSAPPSSFQPVPPASPSRVRDVTYQPQYQVEQTSQSPLDPSPSEPDTKNTAGFFTRTRPLQRSQSLSIPGQKSGSATSRIPKGPSISICCDCKGMLKEIIRATQTSLTMLSSSSSSVDVSQSNNHHILS